MVNPQSQRGRRERVLTTEDPARQSRNQDSEYLAQRRKGRKEIKLPDLASWREAIPVLKPRATEKFSQALKTLQHTNANSTKFVIKNLRNLA
jgi:hypothetical protein